MALPTGNGETLGSHVTHVPLRHLLLDHENPRFGSPGGTATQRDLLNRIVDKFGVNDVLSSIAVNGYFAAEPLVCRRIADSDDAIVVEGNRRLAACLIISGDHRASHHRKRTEDYSQLWKEHGARPIDPVPAIVFEADQLEYGRALLSYLGVRHIASAQPWDSYAKAAWVARVVEAKDLSIHDVSLMIGDQHRTVNRLLEGYYLVQQLTTIGKFNQKDSIRRGRGSVTDFPFSWVYTVLGYASVREFLQLADGEARRQPLADGSLDDGTLLLRSMFGDKSTGQNAAVDDSRKLGSFASLFADRDKVRLLEQGKKLSDIEELTQPIEKRLASGLGILLDTLRDLIARVSEQDIRPAVALDLLSDSRRVRKLAADFDRRLQEIGLDDDDDSDDSYDSEDRGE